MKYIIFSYFGLAFPIAKKLIDEGNDVIVAHIQDVSELGIPGKTEKPEEKKNRLALYNGILDKKPAKQVISEMAKFTKKDDYFVLFDFNDLFKYSEMVLKMGYTNGFFPLKEDFELESDRNKAQVLVDKHYKELETAEVHEFKKVQDAIDFLEETDKYWVLKGNAEQAKTVVPLYDNVDLVKEKLKRTLEKDAKDYENKGFILQERIVDVSELTPEIAFYNGKPLYTTLDIENKPIGSGDIGLQTGCACCLVFQTEEDDEINTIAFPKFVYDKAKERNGLFVWDASILLDCDNEMYFGEYCPNRWGWDSIFNELAMCDSVSDYFESIVKGKNPLKKKFGVSVRGFNIEKADKPMMWVESVEKDVWVYNMEACDGEICSIEGDIDLVVFTGAADTIQKSIDRCYNAVENFAFDGIVYRPHNDFESESYHSAIMARYNLGKSLKLY
jgi:hypothetical protein